MFSAVDGAELIEHSRGTLALEHPHYAAENDRGRVAEKHVDMISFPVPLHNLAALFHCEPFHGSFKKVSLLRSECMPSKLSTQNDVHGQVENTVACTFKIKIPDTLTHRLDSLRPLVVGAVSQMLGNRDQSSSKHYPQIPSVIAKSLIAKYQRNLKCRSVGNVIIPICGDKERQVKFEGEGIRIPALFQKAILPIQLTRPCFADALGRHNISVEFFMRAGQWYGAFSYRTPAARALKPTGVVGVDRNSVGHVATLADPQTGCVLHLGFNPAPTKVVWRGRKATLQKQGRNRLLFKIKRKQSRRTKHENHIVSKVIVDYAATHRRAIVVEDLGTVRKKGSKIRSYTERSQWSFHQLLQFIEYKAALRGVEVIQVNPAYSSQECSRCHGLTKPAGKSYRCSYCGHNDHRDANAAFTLAQRVSPIGGIARDSEGSCSGLLVAPFLGSGGASLGTASLTTCL